MITLVSFLKSERANGILMARGPALVISSVQQVCVGVLLENSALQAMPLEAANGKQRWLVPHHC